MKNIHIIKKYEKFFCTFYSIPFNRNLFFVKIGTEIGALTTIAFTLLTASLGILTIKFQSLTSFIQAKESIFNTDEPAIEILSNFTLLICGILLLLPGFFTDFLGLVLLFPFSRKILVKYLLKKATLRTQNNPSHKSKYKDYIDIDPDN